MPSAAAEGSALPLDEKRPKISFNLHEVWPYWAVTMTTSAVRGKSSLECSFHLYHNFSIRICTESKKVKNIWKIMGLFEEEEL